jgi:hypothetical protein
MEVQTVHKNSDPAVGEKVLIWFKLDLSELKKTKRGPAPVDLIYAGPVSRAPSGGRMDKGTTVTLRRLHPRRSQNADRFHHSMAQRFLLIGPRFRVRINAEDLKPEDIDLQWRWPQNGWATDEVTGCGPLQYWIGFTKS